MTAAHDYIAAELERLRAVGPVVQAPTGDALGWGTDLDLVDDITEDAAELDPNSTRGLGQDLYHRLSASSLIDDRDYGFDVLGLLHKGTTARQLAMASSQATSECREDDRFSDVVVTVTPQNGGKGLRVSAAATPADPTRAPFTLIMAVRDGKTMLEAFNVGARSL